MDYGRRFEGSRSPPGVHQATLIWPLLVGRAAVGLRTPTGGDDRRRLFLLHGGRV